MSPGDLRLLQVLLERLASLVGRSREWRILTDRVADLIEAQVRATPNASGTQPDLFTITNSDKEKPDAKS